MSIRTYGHVLLLLIQRLVGPAADDDFVICRNARMDMLPSRSLVRPAADNGFGYSGKMFIL